jgi:hypothetical protein
MGYLILLVYVPDGLIAPFFFMRELKNADNTSFWLFPSACTLAGGGVGVASPPVALLASRCCFH